MKWWCEHVVCDVCEQVGVAAAGEVEGTQPFKVQFEKRAKWDAWNSRKGMTKEVAIAEYIKEVDAQYAKYGDGP